MKVKVKSTAHALRADGEETAPARSAGSGLPRPRSLTDRDVEMLRWCSRLRFFTSEDLCARFDLHITKARQRLANLVRLGLLQRVRLLHNQPAAHHITRAGLRMLGVSGMPVPTVSLQSFLHDAAVVQEQILLERQSLEVLTEREMRQHGDMCLVQIPPHANVGASTHRPDLAFRRDASASWVAVEVETAAKSDARLEAILTGYLASDVYAMVAYIVPTDALWRRVERVGRAVGIDDRLRIAGLHRSAAA